MHFITDIINKYDSQINFLEFVGFNTFGADDQHIIRVDELVDTDIPEFINVRNTFDPETNELVPMIEIELV